MELFKVYPVFDIELVRGEGSYLFDSNGQKYLDLYGGHAVISIGHGHPYYKKRIKDQLDELAFFSNSVHLPIQKELASKTGMLSGYDDYQMFLCNSGAEANENAIKFASFRNGRKKVLALSGAFHGRTTAAVSMSELPKGWAKINEQIEVEFIPFNDISKMEEALQKKDVCALIIEPIQGVGGINIVSNEYLQMARKATLKHDTVLIIDEVQCGAGRSGKFFAHQWSGIKPDIISVAKGMGNGFPVGGVLVAPYFEAKFGMTGTTYGGNPLACAAALAVIETLEKDNLIENAKVIGTYAIERLKKLKGIGIREVRGRGLMIGVELDQPIKALRTHLLLKDKIFTGASSNPNVIRILPALNIGKKEIDIFIDAIKKYFMENS